MSKPLDIRYVAGLIDGEAGLFVTRSPARNGRQERYRLVVAIGMCNYDVLRDMQATFGGSVSQMKRYQSHHQAAWDWRVTGELAIRVLKRVLPYLRVKRALAETMLEFAPLMLKRGSSLTESNNAKRREVWQRVWQLNNPTTLV